jgi:hypothetical protein
MADYKVQLKDKDGNRQYPVTTTTLVVDAEGKTVEQRLKEIGSGSGGGGGSIDPALLEGYMPMMREFSDDFNDDFAR